MSKKRANQTVMFLAVASFAMVSGCHKQVASAPPAARAPQPSAAPAPMPAPSEAKAAPETPAAAPTLEQLFQQNVKDTFFDYNKADLRPDGQAVLLTDAEFLRAYPEVRFTIAGHCDERGSEEYNLGLGDRRAVAAKRYLVNLGIADNRIQTVSYGKERPFCTQENESCWSQNRRDHLTMAQ
jgi:peptidoglycan-associated lipoprotein